MRNKFMKKPTGTSGFMRISPKDISFKKTIFPDSKEEIEVFIMERFVENTNNQDAPFKFISFVQNEQNDFDFSVETIFGKNDIDLMEIAILDKNGYSLVNNQCNDIEFSRSILKKIKSKSVKYGNKKLPLSLLLYATDFKFNLSELVIQHLQYLLNKEGHCFKMIFFFSLLDNKNGYSRLLFPSDINEFDENRYRNNITINLS